MESITKKNVRPFLSIIIPLYNAEKFVKRCIDSILSQDLALDDYEIIMIDDGSTDLSADICNQYRSTYTNIHYFYQKNQGQGVARNLGIEKALGNYITFADIDDYFLSNTLDKVCKELHQFLPELYITRHEDMLINGRTYIEENKGFPTAKEFLGSELILNGYLPSSVWAKFYTRNLFREKTLRFLPMIIHEDAEFNFKIFLKAKRVIFSETITYFYYWNPLSTDKLISEEKIVKTLISDLRIAKSYKEISQTWDLSKELTQCLLEYSNSLLVSQFIMLMKRKYKISHRNILLVLEEMQNLKLLPMKGKTRSKRTTILKPFFWSAPLYCLLIRLRYQT